MGTDTSAHADGLGLTGDVNVAITLPRLTPTAAPLSLTACAPEGEFLAELAVKLVLNAATTGGHIVKGKVMRNRMIDMQVCAAIWDWCHAVLRQQSSGDVFIFLCELFVLRTNTRRGLPPSCPHSPRCTNCFRSATTSCSTEPLASLLSSAERHPPQRASLSSPPSTAKWTVTSKVRTCRTTS